MLQQGLKNLRDRYCESKRHLGMCAIIDKLAGLCGFHMERGIVRPKFKSDEFIKVLGASLLLMEEVYDVFQWLVLTDYKELLTYLLESIEEPSDFPEGAHDYEFFNELVNSSLLLD
uniref:Uncharacterized protein n=4 Tax=Pararge aegeria TaxID=116150 RepID=S4PNX2_9NEOP